VGGRGQAARVHRAADYKRYVLPIIFLRFLSLRYDRRRAELERLITDPTSDYYTPSKNHVDAILNNPDEYQAAVRRTLQRHGVQPKHLEPITTRVMEQAAATFANWPVLAA
jgi:type I restriction-modification system DNA methylase subunit